MAGLIKDLARRLCTSLLRAAVGQLWGRPPKLDRRAVHRGVATRPLHGHPGGLVRTVILHMRGPGLQEVHARASICLL